MVLTILKCTGAPATHTPAQTQQCCSWEPALMVGRDDALTATGQQSRLLRWKADQLNCKIKISTLDLLGSMNQRFRNDWVTLKIKKNVIKF